MVTEFNKIVQIGLLNKSVAYSAMLCDAFQQSAFTRLFRSKCTSATVPAFDTCILRHTTVSGCDSTLVAHSRLLPSLITRQPAISQQRLGITIQVHKTESPTRPWANTAIHFNKDVPFGNQGKMIEKKDLIRRFELKHKQREKTSWTAAVTQCAQGAQTVTYFQLGVRY